MSHMTKPSFRSHLTLGLAGTLALSFFTATAFAQQKFELVTGKAFDQAVPKSGH
jgi:hypothetical protein